MSDLDPKLQAFIIATLRKASYRHKPRQEALKKARVSRGNYKCNLCGRKDCGRKEINLDHIQPVIPLTGFTTFDDFIARLFCEEDGYQVLCLSCHKLKTKAENEKRAKKPRKGKKK